MSNKLATEILKFAHTVTPLPTETEANGQELFVNWGDNNLYPNFLLELFKTVPLHQSIVSSKNDYLKGDGLVEKATGKPLTVKISYNDTPEVFANKITFDYCIFGWFTVGVLYNRMGKAVAVYHIPANHVRSNRAKSKFWVCDEWSNTRGNIQSYGAFKPGVNKELTPKVYTFTSYVPSANNVYPSIRYESAIINMVTERLINDFGKNNLEEGFSASHIISFFKGLPNSEAGKLFTQKVKAAYSGTKGAKYLIDFNNPPTQQSPAAEVKVTAIDSPDYSAKLDATHKINETNILTAHQAPSRALFGIEQAAGLNGNDLENAYTIFKKVFIAPNRNDIEAGLNILFTAIGFPVVEFKDSGSALPKNLSDATKEKVFFIDELREIEGKAPLPNGEGQKLLEVKAPVAAPAQFSIVKSKGRILTGEDFEQVKDFGTSRDDYEVIAKADFCSHTVKEEFRLQELKFDDARDVENWLLENETDGKTVSQIRAEIRKDLGIELTTSELTLTIKNLTDAGIIGDKEPAKKSKTRDVQIVYEYDIRPGYGKKLITTSRGFCVKLIENNRYYSREDIQKMSAIFGYDVFKHCGGWYQKPGTDEAVDHCRHFWKQVRVIKKKTND